MEEPQLVLGLNQSANPLESPRFLVLRCLLALVLGAVYCVGGYLLVLVCVVFTIWIYSLITSNPPKVTFLDPLDFSSWAVLAAFVPSIYLANRTILKRSRRWTARCEFHGSTLKFFPKVRLGLVSKPVAASLSTVGNIELTSSEIYLDFGLEAADSSNRIAIPMARETAEDDFERLENHMEEFAADSLYSVTTEGEAHYSKPWSFDDLFPWSDPVVSVKLELMGERHDGLTLTADLYRFQVSTRGDVLLLGLEGDAGPAMQIDPTHVRNASGMVLGTHERSPFRISLRLVTGSILEIRCEDQAVLLDSRAIGVIRTHKSIMELFLREPLTAPLAVIIALAKRRDDVF